jgi:hypothetical protein
VNIVDDYLCQKAKTGFTVCGDTCEYARSMEETVYIVCDGIGSGIYANIAAITCAQRIKELLKLGVPPLAICEMVAASMHRARTENIPFSAFSGAVIFPEGQFNLYTYESPNPILIQNGTAMVLSPRYYTSNYEVIGEFTGALFENDSLILMSDGVTQSGMGRDHDFGIGADGIADFINRKLNIQEDIDLVPKKIVEYCAALSGGRYEDDMTLALLNFVPAFELTLLTGPPSKPAMDRDFANMLAAASGKKVVCGSTTIDIISRELGLKTETANLNFSAGFGAPPEYNVEGVDLATEGALTLHQVCNVVDSPIEMFSGNSSVDRLCMMLNEADVIYFHVGNAVNDAHEDLIFKQIGVRVRRKTVKTLAEKLRTMGKLVVEKYY